MKHIGAFGAGFAAGWLVRSTVDSSREAFVRIVTLGYGTVGRVGRIVALEREWLDDLLAEAKTRARPATATQGNGAGPRAPPQ